MRIEHHKPVARGVDKLMYVGDVPPSYSSTSPLVIGAALLIGWLLLRG